MHACTFCQDRFRVRPPGADGNPSASMIMAAVPSPHPSAAKTMFGMEAVDLEALRKRGSGQTDLPAPRESIPHPSDLPAPRESSSRPGDLPTPLRSGDLPAPLRFGDLPVPASAGPSGSTLDLELDLAATHAAPGHLPGLDLILGDPSQSVPPADEASIDLAPLDFAPSSFDLGAGALDLAFEEPGPEPLPEVAEPSPSPSPSSLVAPDFGFSLEFESLGDQPLQGSMVAPRTSLEVPRMPTMMSGIHPGDPPLPQLARPRRSAVRPKAVAAPRQWRKVILVAAGAVVLVAAMGVAAVTILVPRMKAGPAPEQVLGSFADALTRDHYPSYQQAALRLMSAAQGKADAIELRARAAELLMLDVLGRGGGKEIIDRAEAALAQVLEKTEKPSPRLRRARAMIAIGRGKGRDVDTILGDAAGAPDSGIVVGLRRMAEGKPELAIDSFAKYSAARPNETLPVYLSARALEESKRPAASAAYSAVLAKNSAHAGALLARLRMSADRPEAVLAGVEAWILKIATTASRTEIADAHLITGRTEWQQGHTPEAAAAFSRALAADAHNLEANLALGEILLYENKHDEALARFMVPGTATTRTVAGKFGLGGAQIAAGKRAEGMALITQGALEAPGDARGPFWQGFLAETARPAAPADAIKGYRSALAKNPRFVPASLRLATLLQRQGNADEALQVVKAAEAAGAPGATLDLAFGEALIAAKSPDRAEQVFRKALAANPKAGVARLGLSSALQAQGKLALARKELEQLALEQADTPGLRERLAEVLLKLGEKDAALAQYQAEIATGKASYGVRVALAKLALDMHNLELAQSELDHVINDAPGTSEALFTLGRLREAQGDSTRALMEYKRALSFENSPLLQLTLGRALVRAGQEDEALIAFEQASVLPEAWVEHGRVLLRRNDLEKALIDFATAGRAAPKMWEAFLLQGTCLDLMGQNDQAAVAWEHALRVAPTEPEAAYRLGRLEMDHGRAARALPLLRLATTKASDKINWRAEAYFQLGYAELAAGTKAAAAVALKKYIELAPTDAPARPEVEKQLQKFGGR